MIKMKVAGCIGLLCMQSLSFGCEVNPNAQDKCEPALMAAYSQVIAAWKADAKTEDSVFNPDYWPEKPDCSGDAGPCSQLSDITVSLTALPAAQATTNTYAATLSACTGMSGSSCHLYHRVYLIMETQNSDGSVMVRLCRDTSCP